MTLEADRLARQALRGDKSAALRWHQANADRLALGGALTRRLGPSRIELPPPSVDSRLSGTELEIRAGLSGDVESGDLHVRIAAGVPGVAVLDGNVFRSPYDLYTFWHVKPDGEVVLEDVTFQDPVTDDFLADVTERHDADAVEFVRPHVFRWLDANLEDVRSLMAASLVREARDYATEIAELESRLDFLRSQLAGAVIDEIKVRFSGWRHR